MRPRSSAEIKRAYPVVGRPLASDWRHPTADYARSGCGRSLLGPGFDSPRLHSNSERPKTKSSASRYFSWLARWRSVKAYLKSLALCARSWSSPVILSEAKDLSSRIRCPPLRRDIRPSYSHVRVNADRLCGSLWRGRSYACRLASYANARGVRPHTAEGQYILDNRPELLKRLRGYPLPQDLGSALPK